MPRPPPDPLFVLRGHTAEVQAVAFHDAMARLYSGDSIGDLWVWNLDTLRAICKRRHPSEYGILQLHFLPGQPGQPDQVLSQARDGSLKLWDLDEGGLPAEKPLLQLQTYADGFCRCAVQQNVEWPLDRVSGACDLEASEPETCSLLALSGSNMMEVELWTLRNGKGGKLFRTFAQPKGRMECGICLAVCFLQTHQGTWQLVAGYEDGSVALWNVNDSSEPVGVAKFHTEALLAVAARSQEAYSGSADDKLCKMRFGSAEIRVAKQVQLPQSGVADIAVRQDGKIVATGGWDGKIRIFSSKTCNPLAVLQYHRAGIAAVRFDAQTQLLAAASRDKTLSVWKIYS